MRNPTASLIIALTVAGCAGGDTDDLAPDYVKEKRDRETIHGDSRGFVLFSNRKNSVPQTQQSDERSSGGSSAALPPSSNAVGSANAYLWQASLESLDFMPLSQANTSGGVIITDWYAPAETPEERFKITVYILDTALRADALKVTVFRQVDSDKGWVDAPVNEGTAAGLEDNILTRARELRLATTGERSTS